MHATEEHHPSADMAALQALSARLDPALSARLVRDGHALAVVNTDAAMLNTVAVVDDGAYAVDIGAGERIPIGPVIDPETAAARVNRMLATVS